MIKEKRFSKLKKIATLLFIFILINNLFVSSFQSVVYGAVNSLANYNDETGSDKLEEDIKDNFLISTVGSFIYTIASIAEDLVSGIVGMLTGTNTFPWADKVVFNTMELLDINFINPATGSLFESNRGSTAIGKVVGNTYYTVFTIAVAFLSVCVGIMALRLIFASIASEKAKYKQAITQWLMAMLMLFLTHYLISFIFFVNEKMVEVATSMLNTSIAKIEEKNKNTTLQLQTVSKSQKEDLVRSMVSSSKVGEAIAFLNPVNNVVNMINDIKDIVNYINNNSSLRNSISDLCQNKDNFHSEEYLDYTYYLITDRYYVSKVLPTLYDSGANWWDRAVNSLVNLFTNASNSEIQSLASDVAFLGSIDGKTTISEANQAVSDYVKNARGDKDYLKKILLGAWERKHFGTNTVNNKDLFAGLGQFFKDSAWTYKTDSGKAIVGWRPGKNSIIGTILYAIFVVQSIMLFIAYMKRFFYIIILSLFAPIIIVFDFLSKTLS